MKIIIFLVLTFFQGGIYNFEGIKKLESAGNNGPVNNKPGNLRGNNSGKIQTHNSGLHLLINDTLYNPGKGEFLLFPGRINRGEVRIDESFYDGKGLQVKVIRKLPDGRAVTYITGYDGEGNFSFDLGPFSSAPEYDFEAGEVYVRGYQLSIIIEDKEGRQKGGWKFEQGLSRQVTKEKTGMADGNPGVKMIRLQVLKETRQLFDPKFGSMPLFNLRLASGVLSDQDDLRILAGLNDGVSPDKMDARLKIINNSGIEVWNKQINLEKGVLYNSDQIRVSGWPAGDYRIELVPVAGGREWPDGSAVIYRRRENDKKNIIVTPLANWGLIRDNTRNEIEINDFERAWKEWGIGGFNQDDWGFDEVSKDRIGLVSSGDYDSDPVVFQLPAKGFYAVYAKVRELGYFIQIGEKGFIRAVSPGGFNEEEVFLQAGDIPDGIIKIFSGSDPLQWDDGAKAKGSRGSVVSLKLVPVTSSSVETFYQEMMNPPASLVSINDWAEYFGPVWARLLPDQFKSIICGQSEIGIRTIGWSVGRSWVEYHSKLPNTTRFPCVPYSEGKKFFDTGRYDYGRRIKMINDFDPLEEVFNSQKDCDAKIWPWLGMNRHYGITSYGGMFSSKWFKENEQWWQWQKNAGSPRGSAVSYFFPEVRRERTDILFEVAGRGASGIIIGTCRQVPMLLYNPEMVKAYKDNTGIDPLKLDISDGETYKNWISWRADFFTQVLRDLRSGLKDAFSQEGEPVRIVVRIPSSGLLNNLAQGLDIEQWLKEGLVDQLQLDPLEDLGGQGIHDVRPYLELGREHGVKIFGGVGATGFLPRNDSSGNDALERDGINLKHLVPGLKRAYSLLETGVDGIEMYETEMLAIADPVRFMVAMYGNRHRLKKYLENSNLEAVVPVDASNARAGFDNHSRWLGGWTLKGHSGNSL